MRTPASRASPRYPPAVPGGSKGPASPLKASAASTARYPLPKLTTPLPHSDVELAQRFLDGAVAAVRGALRNLEVVRNTRADASRGKLADHEVDLLRVCIVFAGAGLDATLKRLVRDAVPSLAERNALAREKFEAFVVRRLGGEQGIEAARLAPYLLSSNPRARLIDDYVTDLTGGSLQSAQQVETVVAALGINDSHLRKSIPNLRPFFEARNEVSHELDLQEPQRPGDRHRRYRGVTQTIEPAHGALEITQQIVNEVSRLLSTTDGISV
jgi:hypothetical protein